MHCDRPSSRLAEKKRVEKTFLFFEHLLRRCVEKMKVDECMRHLMGPSSRDARSLRPPGEDEIAGQARKDTEDEHIDV